MLAFINLTADVADNPLQGGVARREFAQEQVDPLANNPPGI